MKQLFASLFLLILISPIYSQNGPGGVGKTDGTSDLSLWLKADDLVLNINDPVSIWNDASGFGNNASENTSYGAPTFSYLGVCPVVDFKSENSQYLEIPDSPELNPDNLTTFIVGLRASRDNVYVPFIIKTNNRFMNEGYGIYNYYGLNSFVGVFSNVPKNNQNYNGSFSILNSIYNGSYLVSLINEDKRVVSIGSSMDKSTNDFYIGASPNGYSGNGAGARAFLDGQIGEIITYKKALNVAERIIVSNYLSGKYNLHLVTNNHWTYDADYKNGIIGVGRVDNDTPEHLVSNNGILELSCSEFTGDDSDAIAKEIAGYVFIGNNDKTIDYDCQSSVAIPPEVTYISNKVWKVKFSGFTGDVKLKFDLNNTPILDYINKGLDNKLDIKLLATTKADLSELAMFSSEEISDGLDFSTKTASFTLKGISSKNTTGDVIGYSGVFYVILGYGRSSEYDGSKPEAQRWTYLDDNTTPVACEDGFETITIKNTTSLTVGANHPNVVHYAKVNIEAGSSIIFDENSKVMWDCTFNNEGTVIIEDGASLVPQTGVDGSSNGVLGGSGTYHVKRNSPAYSQDFLYSYWSSPVVGATMGSVFYNGTNNVTPGDYYSYSGTNQAWVSIDENTTMDSGVGYATTGADGISGVIQERTFTGVINHGDVEVPVNIGNGTIDGDPYSNFNLIGNPYPSAINLLEVFNNNSAVWNGTVYYYNHNPANISDGKNSPNDYVTDNGSGSNPPPFGPPPPPGIVDYYAGSMQGFMIQAKNDGTFTFKNDHEVRTVGENKVFYKKAPVSNRIWLKLENDDNVLTTLLAFIDGATDARDDLFDGVVFESSDAMSFYSMIDDVRFSIQGTDENIRSKKIGLGLLAGISGKYSISILQNELEEDIEAFLEDKELGIVNWNLKNQPYSFDIENDNTRLDDRFVISFTESTLANEDVVKLNNVSVNIKNNTLTLLGIENNNYSAVELYSITGRKLQYWNVNNDNIYQINNSVIDGIYVIRIITKSGVVSVKTVR